MLETRSIKMGSNPKVKLAHHIFELDWVKRVQVELKVG